MLDSGPYVVERLIAEGGSARVYRARDETLARTVALKVLDSATTEWRARFLREVQLVAGLAHPHIVSLYAAGQQDGLAYAAMELRPGSVADELRRRARLPWDEALLAATQACQGLDAAWKKGIVHRDVTPSNLLRDADGAIKVADFGLAKDLASDLERGKLVASGTIAEMLATVKGARTIEIEVAGDAQAAGALLRGRPGVEAVQVDGAHASVKYSGSRESAAQLLRALVEGGVAVVSFAERQSSLEDIFMKVAAFEVG